MKCKIHNNAKYEGLESLAEALFKFAHKRFNFTKPVTIVFESNMENVGKLFAPTGHYDPNKSKVVIFVDHRHPKDILRSLAHELVHHRQNCDGHFDGGVSTDPGYAQRDQHMREMEGDAYRTGNVMLFRDWEDNYKKGSTIMEEGKKRRPDYLDLDKDGNKDEPMTKAAEEAEETEEDDDNSDVKEGKSAFHACAAHVKENVSGRQGNPINHTLLEDGSVSHYTVEFADEIVENIPAGKLTVLEMNEHMHAGNRDDYEHDKKKSRRKHEEEEEEDKPLKEWYQNQLHEALLKKFNIKK